MGFKSTNRSIAALVATAPYDDATTGLGASNIEEAIEALDRRVDLLEKRVIEFEFTQSDVQDDRYIVNHDLATEVVSVIVTDSNGEEFEVGIVAIDPNNTAIDLKNLLPIQGVCKGKLFM